MIGIPVDLAARLLFLLIKLVFFPVERQRNSDLLVTLTPPYQVLSTVKISPGWYSWEKSLFFFMILIF